MTLPYSRQRITITPKDGGGSLPYSLTGDFNWFRVLPAAVNPTMQASIVDFRQVQANPRSIGRVQVQIREKVGSPFTAIGFMELGDTYTGPFVEVQFNAPNWANSGTDVGNVFLDVERGNGSLIPSSMSNIAGRNIVTPRNPWEWEGEYLHNTVGSHDLVTQAANVYGFRLEALLVAQGDGAADGDAGVYLYNGVTNLPIARIVVDIGSGPITEKMIATDVPPALRIRTTTASAKDRIHLRWRVL